MKFYFYFVRPINEILADLDISHVILYKDLQFDDENEYLKRIYYRMELKGRLKILVDDSLDRNMIPYYCLDGIQRIISRRYIRLNQFQKQKPNKYDIRL